MSFSASLQSRARINSLRAAPLMWLLGLQDLEAQAPGGSNVSPSAMAQGVFRLGATRQNEAEFICKVIMQGLKGRSSFVVSSGFVSGHDFSRAVKDGKRIGL